MKAENDSITKDRNALGVAVKSAKQDTKEEKKRLNKIIETLEKKNDALEEYRKRKLSEERQERIRIKKQLKKEARQESQKSKGDIKEEFSELNKKAEENEKPVPKTECLLKEKVSNFDAVIKATKELPVDSEKTCVEGLMRKDDLKQIKGEPNENGTEDMEIQSDEVVSEDDEKFIGPKLPPVMTKEEIEAFLQKMIAQFELEQTD